MVTPCRAKVSCRAKTETQQFGRGPPSSTGKRVVLQCVYRHRMSGQVERIPSWLFWFPEQASKEQQFGRHESSSSDESMGTEAERFGGTCGKL